MGLDMYLHAKQYLSNYDDQDKGKIAEINQMFGIVPQEDFGAQEVTFRVAYWRKANAIHDWFVQNCQDGVDECQETYVGRDSLEALVKVCKDVLANRETAAEQLPTASGFFFGGTDYDEWYFGDLEFTVERLEKVLADPALEKCDFYYQSSW